MFAFIILPGHIVQINIIVFIVFFGLVDILHCFSNRNFVNVCQRFIKWIQIVISNDFVSNFMI